MTADLAAAMLVSAVAGLLAHEACHWAVASAFGRDAWIRIDWGGVEANWPVTRLRWYDYLAMIAPQAVGVLLLVAAFVLDYWPLWALPGWLLLTVTGSREDWTPVLLVLGYDADPTEDAS